jgi:hypothetical protein
LQNNRGEATLISAMGYAQTEAQNTARLSASI